MKKENKALQAIIRPKKIIMKYLNMKRNKMLHYKKKWGKAHQIYHNLEIRQGFGSVEIGNCSVGSASFLEYQISVFAEYSVFWKYRFPGILEI